MTEQIAIADWAALDEFLTLKPETSDLTDFVGAIVDNDALATLQRRCTGKGWTLHARPTDDKWYITGIHAKRELGKLIAGAPKTEGHYHYTIRYGTPLYRAESADYKTWLWQQMRAGNTDVMQVLHEIMNGVYVGCDVYIDGPNAAGVVAAAGYLLNQYKGDNLPILAEVCKVAA